MANISRLKAGEISDGNTIFADDIEAELDQLVNSYNSNDTILSALVGGAYTMPGPITFTNGPLTNTISERTAGSGVTIDSLLIKDAGITFTDAGELTIDTGAITATGSYHSIDTESDAASDDLDTISGGAAGRELFVQAENGARTVVLKHNTGNIYNPGATDISLDDEYKLVHLIYSAALSKWVVNSLSASASDTAAGSIEIAVQSEMETGTDTARAVTPGRQQFHPSAAKVWCVWNGTGTQAILASYNVTSITDAGAGRTTVTHATDFSSANYCAALGVEEESADTGIRIAKVRFSTQAAGSIEINTTDGGGTAKDMPHVHAVFFGDQ